MTQRRSVLDRRVIPSKIIGLSTSASSRWIFRRRSIAPLDVPEPPRDSLATNSVRHRAPSITRGETRLVPNDAENLVPRQRSCYVASPMTEIPAPRRT